MLKHIHKLENEISEKGWTQRDLPPEVHQPSFLGGDESDAQLGFKFEWTYLADIAHILLTLPLHLVTLLVTPHQNLPCQIDFLC